MLESSAVMADTFCTVLSAWRVKFKFIKQTGQSAWPHLKCSVATCVAAAILDPTAHPCCAGCLVGPWIMFLSLSPTNLNFLSFVWWLCHFYNV